MSSFGGITGAVIASFLVESNNPSICFMFNSVIALLISLFSMNLSPKIEG